MTDREQALQVFIAKYKSTNESLNFALFEMFYAGWQEHKLSKEPQTDSGRLLKALLKGGH